MRDIEDLVTFVDNAQKLWNGRIYYDVVIDALNELNDACIDMDAVKAERVYNFLNSLQLIRKNDIVLLEVIHSVRDIVLTLKHDVEE